MTATATTVEKQRFLSADQAFTYAEELSKCGQDTDVLVCRIEGMIFGYRVQPASQILPVGWEMVARMWGVGLEIGPLVYAQAGIPTGGKA